ncbi:hypothetical protein BOTBODRAFT_62883 [Botryobasidium botryosum FD-172 SS1]|uniref:4-hydroxybenzoate polyprenyltransferase, mitochondrial n=1 Tax=Botryobasidium botryosum (strain FD-172 SS1) TaxID=930990 RepID=A0A067MXW2_BOTB1|nr:hypothetical protein BOTBODRAFT_62883 [Botryobasidium botryosum FD-172 SS1]
MTLNDKTTRPSKPRSTSAFHAYVRLARKHQFPVGADLIFLPGAWGLGLAAKHNQLEPVALIQLLVIFFAASTTVHSVVCILNDICDVEFDRQVERTKSRPLASGAISITNAWLYMIPWTVVSVLFFYLGNELTFYLGLLGLVPVHALYPLMKRWTYWPQAYLGVAMNWGIWLGWSQVEGSVDWFILLPFFIGAACWTIVYDTIYACQDKEDDIKCGVKSTALLFGEWVKPILSAFAVATLALFSISGHFSHAGWAFYCISVLGAAAHFFWQLWTLKQAEMGDCWSKFTKNSNLGYIVLVGILLDYVLSLPRFRL